MTVLPKELDRIVNGCARKSRYPDLATAEKFARKHGIRYGVEMHAYACDHGCGGYHCATVKRRRR